MPEGFQVTGINSQVQIDGEFANLVLISKHDVSGNGVAFPIMSDRIYAVRVKTPGEYACILPSFDGTSAPFTQVYRVYGSVTFYVFGKASLMPEGNLGLVVYGADGELKYSSNQTNLRVIASKIGEVSAPTPLNTDIEMVTHDAGRVTAWLVAQIPRITHGMNATPIFSNSWAVTYTLASVFLRNDNSQAILSYRSFHDQKTSVRMNSNYIHIKDASRRYDLLLVDVTEV